MCISMAASLPTSIENYLQDAGFTTTETLVLKHLLEEDGLTLRQLAAKTGRSTGVLDQAMKRLLQKTIATKEPINGTLKYTIHSLHSIQEWMEKDMRTKRELLQRRFQDFESFVASLTLDQTRPEMQHYEGLDGMQQAYQRLLEFAQPTTPRSKLKEMLHYVSVTCIPNEDPLRDFRVDYFRERHRRGVFSRVIAHDTSLGRRYQSRDPFEYRKTVLVSEDQHPFTFEKIIAGDIVACLNHSERRACLIRYPELAATERASFEFLWRQQTAPASVVLAEEPEPTTVPAPTRTLSSLREFFLSPRSLVTFAVFGVISAAITYGLYRHNVFLNTERIRERGRSIAATAALQFDARDLEVLRTFRDVTRPQYAKVVRKLDQIRAENPGVVYTYILRPTSDPYFYEFVADADSLDLTTWVDIDSDGIKDDQVAPGYLYFVDNPESSALRKALVAPTADEEPTYDQWGAWLSGVAPILDTEGRADAILGIDFEAAMVHEFSRQTFKPLLYFGVFFLIFIGVRLMALDHSLTQEVWRILKGLLRRWQSSNYVS